jgi:hypothetical protein
MSKVKPSLAGHSDAPGDCRNVNDTYRIVNWNLRNQRLARPEYLIEIEALAVGDAQ